jgi:hypothetical protein
MKVSSRAWMPVALPGRVLCTVEKIGILRDLPRVLTNERRSMLVDAWRKRNGTPGSEFGKEFGHEIICVLLA